MENRLIIKLKQLINQFKLNEKILIVPGFDIGNQILQDLSIKSGGWINFRAATIESLASEIAQEKFLVGGIEKISSIESDFLIDGIFTKSDKAGRFKYFKKYKINTGIIAAMNSIITELKMAGIAPGELKEEYFLSGGKASDLKLIFSGYENILKVKGLADSPDMINAATKILRGSKRQNDIKYI